MSGKPYREDRKGRDQNNYNEDRDETPSDPGTTA